MEKRNKIYWGISCGHHDAALSVVNDDSILICSHSERYSKIKQDPNLHLKQIQEALKFGNPDQICFYENPLNKKIRYLKSFEFFRLVECPLRDLKKVLLSEGVPFPPLTYVNHHLSHAAAGYYTSNFEDAIIIVIDAVGESETLSIYTASSGVLNEKPIWKLKYPESVGLFYSSITNAVGLKSNEEEYILMGMAAYGNREEDKHDLDKYISFSDELLPRWESKINFHKKLDLNFASEQEKFNTAANAQFILENYILLLMKKLRSLFPQNKNWIFSGGVALNCVLNTKIANTLSDGSKLYIYPNPGDAGSALGSILAKTKCKIRLNNLFLGTDIPSRIHNSEIVQYLLRNKLCGLARGRAEFGPRALGNRSLLADPRDPENKNLVNTIKNRQHFRPFAASVLEEHADQFFALPRVIEVSPYMQYLAQVKDPSRFKAITHIDGSSRIQTVNRMSNPTFHSLLREWYSKTGCPFLLNTSLNVRGKPMVNDLEDCSFFQSKYNVEVFN